MKKILGLSLVLAVTLAASQVHAAIVGSIFLTGHDPDFHAQSGGTGAQHINQVAIGYVMDPGFNEFVDAGSTMLLRQD